MKTKISERRWIPDGFHFLGPQDSKNRRELLQGLICIFEENSYSEITLPAFDYTSSFQSQIGGLDPSSFLTAKDYDGFSLSPGIDLTLQVVKGMAGRAHWEENQNVYYIGRKIRDHKKRNASRREILQIGGESIGKSDLFQVVSQVTLLQKLWKRSLGNTQATFVLGHARLLTNIFNLIDWQGDDETSLAHYLYTKNQTELINLATSKGLAQGMIEILKLSLKPVIFSRFGEFRDQLARLWPVDANRIELQATLVEVGDFIRLIENESETFSYIWDPVLIRDVDYYSGLVFQGYMDGYSEPVFAGGVYDSLYETYTEMKKNACGFALHIDPIEEKIYSKK